jgi:hypothetical protein
MQHVTINFLIVLSNATEMKDMRNVVSRLAKFGDRIILFYWIPAGELTKESRENEYMTYRREFGGNVVVECEEELSSTKRRSMLHVILSYNPNLVCLQAGAAQISKASSSQANTEREDTIVEHLLNSGIETLLVH